MVKILISLIGFISLLLIWELSAHFSEHLLFILPAPSDVCAVMVECHGRLLFHSLATLKEMAGGFLIALFVAFPLAWIMERCKTSRAILQPFFITIQCLPMFTLAPIMVIWFGWSYTAIVIPTALMIFFPLTLNIYQGLRSTPENFMNFFRLNQATEWQIFFKLRLPWALPHLFAGFRISSAIAGIGAVAGEWAGAQKGLGVLMLESRRNSDLEMTFSALICLTFLSSSLYGIILLSEKMLLRKRTPKQPSSFKRNPLPASVLRKRPVLYLTLLSLLFISSSCGKNEPHTRLLLDWLPNPNHIPIYVGVEKGFFRQEGINLEIQKMHENGGGISFLTSGQADLLISHLPSTLRASARGAQVKIIGVLIKEPLNALIYNKVNSVHLPQDLSGLRLGYCLGSPDTAFLDYLLQEGHIEPSEKKNVSVDLIAAIGTKSVDFIYGGFWNIEPFQLQMFGIETGCIHLHDFGVPNYYEMIILARRNTIESSLQFTTRFKKALHQSILYCKNNPSAAFESYLKMNPDKRSKTIAWEENSWKATLPLLAEDQSIDPNCIETCYNWFYDRNIFKSPFDYKKLLTINITTFNK